MRTEFRARIPSCTVFGETERADRYRTVAAEIRDAASTHLWRQGIAPHLEPRHLRRNNPALSEVDRKVAQLSGMRAPANGPSRSENWIKKLFSQAYDAIHGICRV